MNRIRGFQMLSVLLVLTLLLPGAMPVQPTSASPVEPQATFDCSTVTGIPQTECEALMALYDATNGDTWTNHTDWLATTTPCSWYGVTCTGGNVGSLSLQQNNLVGVVPPEIGNLSRLSGLYMSDNQLSGAIPPEIGDLTSLSFVSLSGNQLAGAIPLQIGNLASLRYLYLDRNQLTSIPAEIGNLINLVHLSVWGNMLTSIPTEIGGLLALEMLNLDLNSLNNLPAEIGNLVNLQSLSLLDNQLTSIPPGIGNLSVLHYLRLRGNQITSLPPEFGNLIAITSLDLADNPLSGPLPDFLTGLTQLETFYFYGTNWCVPQGGPVPEWLSTIPTVYGTGETCPESFTNCTAVLGIPQNECEALVALYNTCQGAEWHNNTGWLATNLPCDWYGVMCGSGNVNSIYLGSNNLRGPIPPDIGNLGMLRSLDLPANQISNLPPQIGNLTALTELYLQGNQLTVLPPELGNLTALTMLWLHNNQLIGLPPQIGNLAALTELELYNNQLTSLPSEIGNLTALTYLSLSNNQLTTLPPQIGSLSTLTRLTVSNNQLLTLPPEIGNFDSLISLDLRSNRLSGLPLQIGNLTLLRGLWLQNNQLTSLPPEIGNLASLTSLNLAGNQLSDLPSGFENLVSLSTLDLSGNQFSSLPLQISSLVSLPYLFLNDNPLDGQIPISLTALTKLSALTFYNTNWCVPATGEIPVWLRSIPRLYGTGFICEQGLGVLEGRVTSNDLSPIAAIQVNLYRSIWPPLPSPKWQHISVTHTIADGTYRFTNLGQGLGVDYRVQFVDPIHQLTPQYYNAKPTITTATAITITPGIPRTGIDAILAIPQPPAAGVETESGSVVFNPNGTAQITMPQPNLSDITVTRTVTCAVGMPTTVTLLLSTGPQFPMANVGGDAYQATILAAALTANATLRVRATCGATTTETVIGYVTLYDPSGIVSDVRNSQPIAGATVTLYQVPGWEPKTGPTDNRPNTCESNLSKPAGMPWSQPAPTELGIVVNPEVTVTAPQIPYQQTTVEGYYGWDVPQGCWYVTVTAEGYEPFTSPVVGIPPAVTDLNLALTPPSGVDFKVFLPLVLRQQ